MTFKEIVRIVTYAGLVYISVLVVGIAVGYFGWYFSSVIE